MRLRQFVAAIILSIVFVSALAQDGGYTEWMKASELSVLMKKMEEDRVFPAVIDGRVNGAIIQYRTQFIPFLLNLDYFQSKWGMSDSWYKKADEQLKDAGFTEYSHTTFTDQSGNTVHQAIWVLIGR